MSSDRHREASKLRRFKAGNDHRAASWSALPVSDHSELTDRN